MGVGGPNGNGEIFKNFLLGRTLIVKVDDARSFSVTVVSGVPHGIAFFSL